jgi:hypothetical protein
LAREGGSRGGGGVGLSRVIRMRARPLPLLLGLLSLAASRAAAQVGTTTGIITGTVVGPDSQPLAGALVQALCMRRALQRAHAVLTPEQWRKVPEPLKSPEAP